MSKITSRIPAPEIPLPTEAPKRSKMSKITSRATSDRKLSRTAVAEAIKDVKDHFQYLNWHRQELLRIAEAIKDVKDHFQDTTLVGIWKGSREPKRSKMSKITSSCGALASRRPRLHAEAIKDVKDHFQARAQ